MGIRTWFRRRKLAQVNEMIEESDEVRELNIIQVSASDDGWIPVMQFAGSQMEQILTASSWAFSCIAANTEAMAQLEPTVQRAGVGSEAQWVDMPKASPKLAKIIQTPMGSGATVPWSWRDWIRHVVMQLYVYGVAYVDTRSDRLYLLKNPQAVVPETNDAGWPTIYKYGQETYLPGDLIEIRFPKVGAYHGGMSPMEAAWSMVSVGSQAKTRLEWHLTNRASPGIILRIPGTYLRSSQRDEILGYLTDNYTAASKTGTPLVVGDDIDVKEGIGDSYKAQTEELFNADRMSRESIFAVFRTPPMILGVYDKAPIQQYKTAILSWWQTALFPVLAGVLDQINVQWVWPRYGRNVKIWYSLTGSQIGLQLMAERISVAQGLVNLGYPANIAAASAGLTMPHVSELDTPNVPWVLAGRDPGEKKG